MVCLLLILQIVFALVTARLMQLLLTPQQIDVLLLAHNHISLMIPHINVSYLAPPVLLTMLILIQELVLQHVHGNIQLQLGGDLSLKTMIEHV